MGMGKGSGGPQQIKPKKLIRMATRYNKKLAQFQQGLNNVNQVTPYGSLTYEKGPDGQWTATQSFNPGMKKLFKSQMKQNRQLSNIIGNQTGAVGDALSKPLDFNFDTNTVENRLMELGRQRLDPLLADRRSALQTELVGRGIRPGSTAYENAMRSSQQGENDAFNQLALTGRDTALREQNQAVSTALLKRQTPLNEMLALKGGMQIQQPNFVNTAQTGVAGADVAGIYQNQYANDRNRYDQNQQQWQSTLGGLFGLGANALMTFSDRRLKKDITKIGKSDNGLDIYSYRMKAGGPVQIGFMADEVKKKHPKAVKRHESGFDVVDYGKAVA